MYVYVPIWLNWSTEKMSKNSHGGAGVEKKIRQASILLYSKYSLEA